MANNLAAGELLQIARRRKHWGQAKCAEVLGVRQVTISNWERGISRPQPGHRTRICEALDLNPAIFDDDPGEATLQRLLQTSRLYDEAWEQLTPAQRRPFLPQREALIDSIYGMLAEIEQMNEMNEAERQSQ